MKMRNTRGSCVQSFYSRHLLTNLYSHRVFYNKTIQIIPIKDYKIKTPNLYFFASVPFILSFYEYKHFTLPSNSIPIFQKVGKTYDDSYYSSGTSLT